MSTVYYFVPNVNLVYLITSFSVIEENYLVNHIAFPMLNYWKLKGKCRRTPFQRCTAYWFITSTLRP